MFDFFDPLPIFWLPRVMLFSYVWSPVFYSPESAPQQHSPHPCPHQVGRMGRWPPHYAPRLCYNQLPEVGKGVRGELFTTSFHCRPSNPSPSRLTRSTYHLALVGENFPPTSIPLVQEAARKMMCCIDAQNCRSFSQTTAHPE